MKILASLVFFMFAAVTTRLWFLQVLASDQFSALASQNQIRIVPLTPLRGEIFDRTGDLLVENHASTVVLVDRSELQGQGDTVLARLSSLLHIPVADLASRLNSVKYLPFQPVPVAENVAKADVFYIEEHHDLFPGVSYRQEAVQVYPKGTLAAHVLGYLGPITTAQLKEKQFSHYEADELVGQSGVQSSYESDLHGVDGYRGVQVNAQGKVLNNDFGGIPPSPGNNVYLSIDDKIQRMAEQSLSLGIDLARHTPSGISGGTLPATGGAVVVMDPNNGQVLALASNPTYDPAIFDSGLTPDEATSLDLNPKTPPSHDNPFLDRATQGLYPAGSTFKPFVAAAAMKEGFASPTGSYDCPAQYIAPEDVKKHPWHNWDPVDRGFISLTDALAISCDTVFYQFGNDFWLKYGGGNRNELLQQDLGQMGFGQFTHVDLPGEQPGKIPTYETLKQIFAREHKRFFGWEPGDSLNLSIGQGLLQVTPLQMAMAYSAIANGGTLYAPRIGLKVVTPDGHLVTNVAPQKIRRIPLPPSRVAFLRDALTQVTLNGTASFAFAGFPLERIPVAGKTGTADIPPRAPISWFAGMAPANHPKYVVVAMVEQGGHGATTAAPIVRHIMEQLFGIVGSKTLQAGNVVD